jgi:Concanavalin A-like lectin/glucanases superfamily
MRLLEAYICLSLTSFCSAYKVKHTGPTFVFDAFADVATNSFIDQSQTSKIINSSGGLTSSVNPATVQTYGSGLVGLYHFDNVYVRSQTNSLYRASSPCGSATDCVDAVIVGTGTQSVPILTTNGKFGSALQVGPGGTNYAQIRPGPFPKYQPRVGVSQAIWFQSKAKNSQGNAIWPSSSLTELQFNNFDLSLDENSSCLTCTIRGNGGFVASQYCLGSAPSFPLNAWFHAVCTYDVDSKLNLYLNGKLKATTTQPLPDGEFQHGDNQPFGLGNRPGNYDNYLAYVLEDSFTGYLDDFALWERALLPGEVEALYLSNIPLAATPRVVLTTENIERVNNNPNDPFANEFDAITVSWAGTNTDNVVVEISTDSGKSWCKVENSVPFTDKFHGGSDLICLFSSVTLKVRAVFTGGQEIKLTNLKADFLSKSPLEPAWNRVSIG